MPHLPPGAYAHERSYTLRQYVRSAELYGGYDSVFEEAARDLKPLDLAHLCMAMRGMSRRPGSRVRESFKLGSREREALVLALIRQAVRTDSIADLVGCSRGYVYKVAQAAEMGSESPQTGGLKCTGELPLPIPLPA